MLEKSPQSPFLRSLSIIIFYIYVFHLRAGLPFRLLPNILFGRLCSGILWTWSYHSSAIFSFFFVIDHSTSIRFHISPVLILPFLVICSYLVIKSNSTGLILFCIAVVIGHTFAPYRVSIQYFDLNDSLVKMLLNINP